MCTSRIRFAVRRTLHTAIRMGPHCSARAVLSHVLHQGPSITLHEPLPCWGTPLPRVMVLPISHCGIGPFRIDVCR